MGTVVKVMGRPTAIVYCFDCPYCQANLTIDFPTTIVDINVEHVEGGKPLKEEDKPES